MIIKIEQFRGMAPRLSPDVLPPNMAQSASNCLFGSGTLRAIPLASAVVVNELDSVRSGIVKSIYRFGERWLTWNVDVDVCKSSLALDSYDRRYWTGDGDPKLASQARAFGGAAGAARPSYSWALGLDKPTIAPTVSANASTGDPINDVTRTYCYTNVSEYGEESQPSAPSASVTVAPGQEVLVSNLGDFASTSTNIILKRIYRSASGSAATSFNFVGELALGGGSTFSDTVDEAMLGEVLPSTEWLPPHKQMSSIPYSVLAGLTTHPGGFMVAFYNNVLCFSEPFFPHAWPAKYQVTVEGDIKGIAIFGNSILVTTTMMPYVVTGSVPGQMSIERLEKGESCLLKRGVVDMGYGAIYPGPSGLWAVGTGSVELITDQMLTKKEWSAYSSDLVFSVQYETLYIGFMTTGGFVFDTKTGEFSTHGFTATGGWYDREVGKLYLVNSGVIYEWVASSSNQSFVWKSKKFILDAPTSFSIGRITSGGAVTVKVYGDGALKHTYSKVGAGRSFFRLPSGIVKNTLEIQLEGSAEVSSVEVASSMSELSQV